MNLFFSIFGFSRPPRAKKSFFLFARAVAPIINEHGSKADYDAADGGKKRQIVGVGTGRIFLVGSAGALGVATVPECAGRVLGFLEQDAG